MPFPSQGLSAGDQMERDNKWRSSNLIYMIDLVKSKYDTVCHLVDTK
jgi:hypothetical protein